MSIYIKLLKVKPIVVIWMVAFCGQLFLQTAAQAASPVRRFSQKVVVIDPGHGGHVDGAAGPSGTLEKTIVLDFSQRVYELLKPRYRVHLTRTADYALDGYQRADRANHLKADLFISFHTGGSYRRQSNGIEIYYFQAAPSPPSLPAGQSSSHSARAEVPPWDGLQLKHRPSSRRLAQMFKQRLEADRIGRTCNVHAAPLLVLGGLDMPAVLVEIGYLSNPTEEKQLQDPRHLDALAEAVSRSVHEYFDKE